MELDLSLGDASKPLGLLAKSRREVNTTPNNGLGFGMALGINSNDEHNPGKSQDDDDDDDHKSLIRLNNTTRDDPPLQLHLLPLAPVPRHTPWSSDNGSSEGGSSGNDIVEGDRASSRASDDDENGLARKKLRLSKEQSVYLEESFKEHNTLNPKQKVALAKELNLRPRQVEVWFQNRRARTKLKQTEVDCEYLKRCCETLTEENRRLHKEVQELRALKTSNSFFSHLPATTLTMCPSCERLATAATTAATTILANPTVPTTPFTLSRPRLFPFYDTPTHPHKSAAS